MLDEIRLISAYIAAGNAKEFGGLFSANPGSHRVAFLIDLWLENIASGRTVSRSQ
jgi:hypothetical protein